MRLIKIFGLAIAALLIATALIGTSFASATVLCKANEEICSKANTYPAGTASKLELEEGTSAVLNAGILKVECKESIIKAETTAESGKPLPGKAISLTFGSCGSCSVEALNLPFKLGIEATGKGNGVLEAKNGGKGNPSATATCSGLTCVYGAEAIKFSAEGGEPARLLAKEIVLNKVEAGSNVLCPKTATWTAIYIKWIPFGVFFTF